MCEACAFCIVLPTLLVSSSIAPAVNHAIAGWAFAAMGIGAVGCAAGGMLSRRFGSARVGAFMRGLSGLLRAVSFERPLGPPRKSP